MNTRDLMMNDIVYWVNAPYGSDVVRVLSIWGDIVAIQHEQHRFVNAKDLRPIELTDLVFKNSGFNENRWNHEYWHDSLSKEFMFGVLDFTHIGGDDSGVFIGATYVHELQHILRFLGRCDIANNLKINHSSTNDK